MFKASVEILPALSSASFLIKKFDKRCFDAPFHFHPEYEMTYITEGSGKRFVGNNMSGFQKNDLIFIGSNLPHCWKLNTPKKKESSSIVLQFHYDFMGGNFWLSPEMRNIQKLLKRSSSGIEFKGKIKDQIKGLMIECLNEKKNFKKFIYLLEILNKLSTTRDFTSLNKKIPSPSQSDFNRERSNKVFAYIVENFHENVSLNEAARTIGMTPTSFCKYFKRTTRRTFVETVTDFRINYATQQLIETDKTVTDICFESGFKDMSHFYKTFTSRMEISPLNYRKQFLKETVNE
jgi:AraC-like DNA-binding protein